MPDPAQYRGALAKGTPVRLAIAAAKAAIAGGRVSRADALNGDAPDHELGISRCKALPLLMAIPGIGRATALEILDHERIDRDDRIGKLGWATRAKLLELVDMSLETPGTAPVVPDQSWRP